MDTLSQATVCGGSEAVTPSLWGCPHQLLPRWQRAQQNHQSMKMNKHKGDTSQTNDQNQNHEEINASSKRRDDPETSWFFPSETFLSWFFFPRFSSGSSPGISTGFFPGCFPGFFSGFFSGSFPGLSPGCFPRFSSGFFSWLLSW